MAPRKAIIMKMHKIVKKIKKVVAPGWSKKLTVMGLFMLVNIFQLAVAAAPSEPLSPTPENLQQISSLTALSPLEGNHKTLRAILTGYSSTPDQTDDTPWITAANTGVRDGIVASNFLPFYTKIRVPELFGDKVFVVEDRMHERFNDMKIVDIWFPNREAAADFGLQKATIQILF